MTLIDGDQRRRALTDLDTTLLVEAAAGTGKTSLMAGRVAMALASGRQPRHLAAITFTELAAAELGHRIHQTVQALLNGQVPTVLAGVLPTGLSDAQRNALSSAARDLDQLTTTTIHGFCQTILHSHAVAAGLDPGTKVIDAPAAEAMFESLFSQWLTERLSGVGTGPDDALVVLSQHDPLGVVKLLKELAELRRAHPTAGTPAMPDNRSDTEFVEAVDEFARWYACNPGDDFTAGLVTDLQALAAFYTGAFASRPGFAELWRLAHPPRIRAMKKDVLELQSYRRRTAWKRAHGDDRGEQLGAEAESHFGRADLAYRSLLGTIGQGLIASLATEFDGLLARYREQKRAAAVADFDDLLIHARDLVTAHQEVRQALAERYRCIFVDEFQDTDPIQAELLFLIGAEAKPTHWQDAVLRPGSLFLVGDPKQAIYRFRGADIEVYNSAKANVAGPSRGAIIDVTANFRSRKGILDHVNASFEPVLSRTDQPGYVPLSHTIELPDHGLPCIAKLTVQVPQRESSDGQREAEAQAVADVCQRLIGAHEIVRPDGSRSHLRGGDIALLAPTSRDLWRYERALEARRISAASQAGRTLFLRQETQDVLALLRTLSDASDTLAFGALMRGPLVGITDNELLEITAALSEAERPGSFTVLSDAERVAHPLARSVLETLQRLRRRAGITTPALLLRQAIEELNVRVVLTARHHNRSARAIANIDALVERARPYDVSGLQAFVRDFQRDWEQKSRVAEGRTDTSEDAVELVTMHSSKGLEWPVVIPINTATLLRSSGQFVLRRSDNTLHWVLGGVPPPHLDRARAEENAGEARQRERLWYVACTRARDLLIIPQLPGADGSSWSRILDLGQSRLPELDLSGLPEPAPDTTVPPRNEQSPERFVGEAEKVAEASPPLAWRRPSDHDPDRAIVAAGPVSDFNDTAELTLTPGAGRLRGIILHKLMEEFLTGELPEEGEATHARARLLTEQIGSASPDAAEATPDPSEMASTALRTIRAPEIAKLKLLLVPELAVWSEQEGEQVAGRADAVAVEEGAISVVLDWKSDVAPTAQDRAQHAAQLTDYRNTVGASRGAVVYMSLGEIAWL